MGTSGRLLRFPVERRETVRNETEAQNAAHAVWDGARAGEQLRLPTGRLYALDGSELVRRPGWFGVRLRP